MTAETRPPESRADHVIAQARAFLSGIAEELHAIGAGADTQAVAYVETQTGDGLVRWGVGVHDSIVVASLRAVLSAASR